MARTVLFTTTDWSESRPALRPARAVRKRHALALAAAALLATPAAQALVVFTGNAPVYVGAWFNGNFTEVQEFQFALDWQGWCNTRVGAVCSNHRYWNVAGNWDSGVEPGGASEVRIESGNTVRVGQFNSIYQGGISGLAFAGVLSAAGRVELYGELRVVNASFADLHNNRDNFGTLHTTGLSTVALLSSGAGRFRGVGGTTVVQSFTPSPVRNLFEPLIGPGHVFQFIGNSTGVGVAVRLEPTARFVNGGQLDLAGGSIGLQGTATFAELPTVINTGTLSGNGSVSSARFDNQGTVQLGNGQVMSLGNWGEHTGSFVGAAGSTLNFFGIGGAGHRMAPGSQVSTLGGVSFGNGNHLVQGTFSAQSVAYSTAGALGFEGPRPQIGRLVLSGGGSVGLRNAGGAAIGELVIDSNFSRVDVDTGAPLDLQRLRLVAGSFNGRAPVTITEHVEWSSGFFINSQPTTVSGNWQLLPGTRVFRAPVTNSGNLSWEGGNFSEWSGRLNVQQGKSFDILGDFNSAGGLGGKLVNSGTLSKSAGAGRSELAMAVDNIGGTVRSLSGTLALTGGGTHTDATFAASMGAAIELAGGTTFGGQITPSGRLNLTGGDFTLLAGTSYLHAPGNRFDVARVSIHAGAHLSVVDALVTTGSLNNLGTFTPSSHVRINGDFLQQGDFGLNPGKDLVVLGTFDNSQLLTVRDARLQVDRLINRSTLHVIGSSSFSVTTLDNRGTLVLGPSSGLPGASAHIGGFGNSLNSGSLRVDGNGVYIASTDLQNSGQISNEGTWEAGGHFSQTGIGRFSNAGALTIDGTAGLFDTAQISNSGSLTLRGGVLDINAGTQVSGPGSFLQVAGVTRVNGRLQAANGIDIQGGVLKGAGTVEGVVNIGPGGLWQPGNSPGTMTVLGDADLSGALEIEVTTSSVFDRLVVLNNFTARDAANITFVFDAGYVPAELDSHSLTWLSASGTNFAPGVTLSTSGLPQGWSRSLSPDGRQLLISNDAALQIPIRGSHAVPAGGVQFNALSSSSANYPLLDRLDNAGYFHNRAGASTAVLGVLNNGAGATLVNRGELSATALNNAGLLNNRSSGLLQVNTLSNSGRLVNEGNVQVLNDFTNSEGAVLEQRGSMQLQGLSSNRGTLLVAGPLVYAYAFNNSGDVTIEPTGSIVGAAGSYFWHSAGELRVDGLLAASDVSVFGGHLSGNGQIQGGLTTFAAIGPGNSIGQFTVQGDLDSRGGLDLEIASATSFDRLVVTGNATLLGATTMYLLGNYRPTLGDSFGFLSVAGTLQGGNPMNWMVLRLVDPSDAQSGWTLWANADGIYDANVPGPWRAEFNQGTLSITAVPEPAAWALWLAGLAAVARIARRRVV